MVSVTYTFVWSIKKIFLEENVKELKAYGI